MKLQYEGFWKNSAHPELPMPKEFKRPWKGKDSFLEKLAQIETRTEVTAYRGISICRICRCVNGNEEFQPLVSIHEIHREQVERLLLDFDEETQSWSMYAGYCFDFLDDVQEAATQFMRDQGIWPAPSKENQ